MKKLLALALAAAFVCGCTKVGTQTSTTANAGGRVNDFTVPHTLRYATAEDVNTLNPHLAQQTTLGLMSSLTMAWLIKWNQKNLPIPELATEVPTKANGGISADGLTVTYHLRKDAKWSDGVPFNADDVVFSTGVVLNKANNEVSRTGWDRITKVDEPDKYTVVYHLSKPYSPFVVTFFSSAGANPCILPKHLLAQYSNINNVAYNSLPIGIGPFKYKKWDRTNQVVMVANPNYFRGTPKLQQVIFKIIPDRNTVTTQLEGKELDLWYPVPGSFFARVKDLQPYTYIRHPAYYFNHIDFRINSPKMRDPAVRRALLMATDRATLREKIAHGVGYLQEEPAPQTAPYYDPSIKMTPFDIAAANKLLDEAGWARGPDNVRAKGGIKLVLDYASGTGLPDVDAQIELMRSWWKQIGIELSVRKYPSPLFFAPVQQGGIVYGDKWDIINFAWGADPIGDYSFLYACDEIPPNGQNDVRWCNPKADKAMHELFTHYDQRERNADDKVLFGEFVKDVPSIVTTGREDIFVFNKDLKNFNPNAVTPFDDMMNVDI